LLFKNKSFGKDYIDLNLNVQKKSTLRAIFQAKAHCTRLEIISDVVSEKARSGKIPIPHRKYRYHIGNTDTTSVSSDITSVFPMWYRNFSATCLSDTTSEIISNLVLFPTKNRINCCNF
jgi:hypothetical protein